MDRSPGLPFPNSEPGWLWDNDSCRSQGCSARELAIVGSILGTAVGDAIGLPYEGLSPRRAQRLFGPPDRHHFLFGRGMISDDTEHTCMVAQALMESSDDADFARNFAKRLRNWLWLLPAGIGLATLRACIKLSLGFSPSNSGVCSAGNGPAMRAAVLGATIDDLGRLRAYVSQSTRITHTHPAAECGALAIALAARLGRLHRHVPPLQFIAKFEQLCTQQLEQKLWEQIKRGAESVERGESTRDFAASIGLSRGVTGYINNTVPVVLHAWLTYPDDFRKAVQSAVLCGGDTDTTAAIVGGIVGAAVGKKGIPDDWLNGVRDWPRSIAWMEQLGHALATVELARESPTAPHLPWLGVFARNAVFAVVVLLHGFRRLLPPY